MTELTLRWALMVVCLIVLTVSFSLLLVASWRHHRAVKADLANFHPTLWVEMAWTAAPCIVVLLLVWPAARVFWTP